MFDNPRQELLEENSEVISRHRKKCPVVNLKIFNQNFNALIDSGAELSCISASLFDSLQQYGNIPTLPVTGVTIVGAVGSKTRIIKKQAFIKVDFGDNFVTEICFLVVEKLVVPMLLGADWLDETVASINFYDKILSVYSEDAVHHVKIHNVSEDESGLCNIDYIGIGIKFDENALQCHGNIPGDDDQTNITTDNSSERISCALILQKIMNVKYEKYRDCLSAEKDTEEPTPYKIYQLVKQIKNLNKTQKRKIAKIFIKNIKVFSSQPGRVKDYEYEIKVNNNIPFKAMHYPIPVSHQKATAQEIEKMLKLRIIRKQSTPFVNPLVPVIKKDGSVRLCLDARRTNKLIIPDYDGPMPPEEILQRFSGKKFLSSFDLTSSFWQVPLSKESQQYTGFIYNGESYVFEVTPFGLSISVASLHRCLTTRLGPEILDFTTIYVDDLLVASTTFNEHCLHLNKLLTCIRNIGMTLKLSKTMLCREEVPFLGMILTPHGVFPDDKKLQGIVDFARPNNPKNIQEFVGTCGYLQRFHASYAQTVSPLYELLQSDTPWCWTERHETAFIETKKLFQKVGLLHHPIPGKRLYIESDASLAGIGAVVYYLDDNNEKCIVSCASRSLKAAEKNYSICEIELLAIQFALLRLRYFVANTPLTIRTDHKALSFMMKCRLLNARLTRWILAIQDYNFEIEYIRGKDNYFADALSRNPPVETESCKSNLLGEYNEIIIAPITIDNKKINIPEISNLMTLQEQDEKINIIRKILKNEVENVEKLKLENIKKYYILYKNILYKNCSNVWKVFLPQSLVNIVTTAFHEHFGHFGTFKISHAVSNHFYWPRLLRDVRRIVSSCDICQKAKHKNMLYHGESQSNIPTCPGECIAVDFYGELPKSRFGYCYVFVLLDIFSKFVVLYPMKKATTQAILHKIKNDYIPMLGKPKSILSDNAKQFSNKWKRALNDEGIITKYSAVYCPTSNPAERPLKEVGRIIRTYCHEKHTKWLDLLPMVARWINISVNESTGFTPFQLQHGRKPELEVKQLIKPPLLNNDPISIEDLYVIARKRMQYKAEARQKIANSKGILFHFKPGDFVLIKSHRLSSAQNKEIAKFFLVYEGPYKVLKSIGPSTYSISKIDNDIQFAVHNIKNLKPYVKPVNLTVNQ
jgi:hypothetical protein